jgi:hypothetical protein
MARKMLKANLRIQGYKSQCEGTFIFSGHQYPIKHFVAAGFPVYTRSSFW